MVSQTDAKQLMWFRAALILVFIYAAWFLFYFWQTPLGLTPVLDGAENVRLAEEIYQNTLAKEPFYRSMLYPAFLAIFRFMGFAASDLNSIAAITGIVFHGLNALLVGFLSFLLWKNSGAALAAMLIYGFYPPALHFAVDPLDITMAQSFLLLGIISSILAFQDDGNYSRAVLAGFFIGLGALVRANLLPAAAVWFVFLFLKKMRYRAAIALISLMVPLLAGGIINHWHSGQFRILPWQGAFNLYAANNQHANGKYFQQRFLLTDRELGTNPARLESEIAYRQVTGADFPYEIDEFNRFWREQTIDQIREAPFVWLKLMLKKSYFLLNNFEQYNNKTFSFHKQLSPVLRFNPLCFGLIIVLATITCVYCKFEFQHKLVLQTIVFLGFGILAFYVSARFRMLLVPFLVGLAAGIFALPRQVLYSKKTVIALIFSAAVTFSAFAGATDTSTWNSDRLLIAHACARLGRTWEQMHWADEVLQNQPDNIQAIRLKIVAFTNLALAGELTDPQKWHLVTREMKFLEKNQLYFQDTIFLQGCYQYSFKRNSRDAVQLWQTGLEQSNQKDLFLAALIAADSIEVNDEIIELAQKSPFLWYVLVWSGKIKSDNQVKLEKNAVSFKILFDLSG